jgi:hypothetical protein
MTNRKPSDAGAVLPEDLRRGERWESLVIYFHGIIESLTSQWRGVRVFAALRASSSKSDKIRQARSIVVVPSGVFS